MAFKKENGSLSIWRVVIGVLVAFLLSVAGWVFSEVRDVSITYETIENHNIDNWKVINRMDRIEEKLIEQQTRIEDKIDETNRFLRNYFSTHD